MCLCVCVCVCLIDQSCPTLCNPVDYSPPGSSVQGDSPDKNTGVGCHALLQGIFPIQGSNPGLPHCRWILYGLNHQGRLWGPEDREAERTTKSFFSGNSSMPAQSLSHVRLFATLSRVSYVSCIGRQVLYLLAPPRKPSISAAGFQISYSPSWTNRKILGVGFAQHYEFRSNRHQRLLKRCQWPKLDCLSTTELWLIAIFFLWTCFKRHFLYADTL